MQTLDKIAPTDSKGFKNWWGQVAKLLGGQVGVGRAKDNIAVNVSTGVIYIAPYQPPSRWFQMESWIESETEQGHHGFKLRNTGLTPNVVAKVIKGTWGKHLWESSDDMRMDALEDVMLQEAENIRYRTGLTETKWDHRERLYGHEYGPAQEFAVKIQDRGAKTIQIRKKGNQWVVKWMEKFGAKLDEGVVTERQKTQAHMSMSLNPREHRLGAFKVNDPVIREILGSADKNLEHQALGGWKALNKVSYGDLPKALKRDNIADAQDVIAGKPRQAFQTWMQNVHVISPGIAKFIRAHAELASVLFYAYMLRVSGRDMADLIFKRYFRSQNEYEPSQRVKMRDKRRRKASSLKPGSQASMFPESVMDEAVSDAQAKQASEMIIKMLDVALRKAVGSNIKGFTGDKGGTVMGRWVQKSPKGEHTMIVRIRPKTTYFSVSTYTKHKGANIKPKMLDDVTVDMRRVWKGQKKYDWSPLVDLFKAEIKDAGNMSVMSVESHDALGGLLSEIRQGAGLEERKSKCGRKPRGRGRMDGKGPHMRDDDDDLEEARKKIDLMALAQKYVKWAKEQPLDDRYYFDGMVINLKAEMKTMRLGWDEVHRLAMMFGIKDPARSARQVVIQIVSAIRDGKKPRLSPGKISLLRQEAGLEEARATEEQKAEMLKMADTIKAQLKRQGIKRVRASKSLGGWVFNMRVKSIPNAPENQVEMVNMVWGPLDKMLQKMGGDGPGIGGPGASRYYTFPSGIRVMGGANTNENAVIVRVSGP